MVDPFGGTDRMNVIVIVETLVAFMIAITLHEAAHIGMAALLGDGSSVSQGRLSLAPSRQMTATGTIVAVFVSFTALAGIGWGRPMAVDAQRMRVGPNVGTILTALAGPALNILLGVGIAFGLWSVPGTSALAAHLPMCPYDAHGLSLQACLSDAQPVYVLRLEQFGMIFAVTSIAIGLLNLLPLYPLDGYHILFALLPVRAAIRYRNWMPYMELTLLVLFVVLPILLAGFGNGNFNPGHWFAEWAYSIAQNITHGTFGFYLAL
jgi:Zn-dependent protease